MLKLPWGKLNANKFLSQIVMVLAVGDPAVKDIKIYIIIFSHNIGNINSGIIHKYDKINIIHSIA